MPDLDLLIKEWSHFVGLNKLKSMFTMVNLIVLLVGISSYLIIMFDHVIPLIDCMSKDCSGFIKVCCIIIVLFNNNYSFISLFVLHSQLNIC